MNIFTFERYGNVYPNIFRFIFICIHFTELIVWKQNRSIFFIVGFIWSIVEFFLVIFKFRILKNTNFFIAIIQSLLRGFSEGGIVASIALHIKKNIVSTIFLIFNSILNIYLSPDLSNKISKRQVTFIQLRICLCLSLYYIFKKEKIYPLKSAFYMILLGFIWNLVAHIIGHKKCFFFE